MNDPSEFTHILARAQSGDDAAENQLCEMVDQELRKLAGRLVRNNDQDRPTSLVNELFLRLFRSRVVDDLINRRYFFAVAIDQMRQILRTRIRERRSWKRGGRMQRQSLDIALDQYLDDFTARNSLDFLALDEALAALRNNEATARQYEIVNLHYFLGFEQQEISEFLDVSSKTVARDLKNAKAKLAMQLDGRP